MNGGEVVAYAAIKPAANHRDPVVVAAVTTISSSFGRAAPSNRLPPLNPPQMKVELCAECSMGEGVVPDIFNGLIV